MRNKRNMENTKDDIQKTIDGQCFYVAPDKENHANRYRQTANTTKTKCLSQKRNILNKKNKIHAAQTKNYTRHNETNQKYT